MPKQPNNENWPHIGHAEDAIQVIDELLPQLYTMLPARRFRNELQNGLEAIKDALERGII
jgi:hypothetical protein